MSEAGQTPVSVPPVIRVAAGADRYDARWNNGITLVTLKVAAQDSPSLFIAEITAMPKGGPGRHLHYEQDEWFYILESEFIIEVGSERFRLNPGDSLFAPRKIPHVWANAGNEPGKLLALLTPAGDMEAFFREAAKSSTLPDSALFRAHGMELVGPPLSFD